MIAYCVLAMLSETEPKWIVFDLKSYDKILLHYLSVIYFITNQYFPENLRHKFQHNSLFRRNPQLSPGVLIQRIGDIPV